MTTIHRSAFVPFSPQQMFELVNNIEQYPDFLAWCPKAHVLSVSDNEMQATLYIAKGVWAQSFTTINRLVPHERVEMRLQEGPFRALEGVWQFNSIADQGCQVSLSLSFEFSNQLLALTVGPIFHQMASSLVDAFTARAHEVYVTA